jgi:hypothetical protein
MAPVPTDLHAWRRTSLAPALLAILLAIAGTALALMRLRWPAIPAAAALVPIALALGLVALGMARRIRHLLAAARRR